MNNVKLFIEELKFVVENELIINKYVLEQLHDSFNLNPVLITRIYHLLLKNKQVLPFVYDIEAEIYDYLVSEEMADNKTFYGATTHVANQFGSSQTYIKWKLNQSKTTLRKHDSQMNRLTSEFS
ncbi:hypothetical protein [Metabacillus malikii]|uniref:HTH araC/xylS-type domain-containing protein n=1 Tax=Metabacillus malikii TaxID=1504265 RepID=A0ABT9ZER3_9BACI|nr:hypothetical protein [Metabacillus malikii]MDQ0230419.1 hypothetical protein [Metabacillus malikii]